MLNHLAQNTFIYFSPTLDIYANTWHNGFIQTKGKNMSYMKCRITDEEVNNPWEGEGEDATQSRCPLSLTIDELMGDDHYPYITKNKSWGFDFGVESAGDEEMEATKIHPMGMESMADFCRRFLSFYDRATKEGV